MRTGATRRSRRPGIALFVLMLVLASPAWTATLQSGLDLSNPAAAYRTFLSEADRIGRLYQAYQAAPSFSGQLTLGRAVVRLALDAFDLEAVPVAARPREGALGAAMLADILNRVPAPSAEALAAAEGASDSPPARWAIPGTDIRLTRITQGPRAGDYVFSAATLGRLPEFHAQIIDEPPLRPTPVSNWTEAQAHFVGPLLVRLPVDELPAWMRDTVLGTPVWKAIAALLLLALAVATQRGWSALVRRLEPARRGWRLRLLRLSRPLGLIVITLVFAAFLVTQVTPGGMVAEVAATLAGAVLVAAAAWSAWHLCWLVAELLIASPRIPEDTYDAHLLRLVARVASVLAVGVIAIYGASLLGVPALGLLAGVSIGGIALALAAQSTVENLLGGFAIFADRPFRVGDMIRQGMLSGTVEGIGPRSSRIRAADGSLTSVPNGELAKLQLTNLSARDRWVFTHCFPLPEGLSAAAIAGLTGTLRARISAHPALAGAPAPPRVVLVPLDATRLAIEVSAPVAVTSQDALLAAQEALILEALRVLEQDAV